MLTRRLTVVFAGLVMAASASAGVNRWTTTGPWGGAVLSIEKAPADARILYAGTFYGLYVSVNGGASWSVGAASGEHVPEVSLSAGPPGAVYASTGSGALLRSRDFGATWSESTAPPPATVLSLAVDVLGVAYAGTSTAGIWRSTDAGETWSRSDSGLPSNLEIHDLLPVTSAGLIYAATTGGIFRSGDLGIHWVRVFDLAARDLDADGGGRLYAANMQQGIFFSADGESWTRLEGGPSFPQQPTEVAADPGGGAVWAAGWGRLFRWTLATGWLEPLPPVDNSAIYDLDSLTDDSMLLASGHGVLRSNGALEWEEINEGLLGRPTYFLAIDRVGGAVYAAGSRDVFRLARTAGPWTSSRTPDAAVWPCPNQVIGLDVLQAPEAAEVYVWTYREFQFRGCLGGEGFWKNLDGTRWISAGLPSGRLEVDPVAQEVAYLSFWVCREVVFPFCVQFDWFIDGTEEGGAHWDRRHERLGGPSIFVVAVDPVDPRTVYGKDNHVLVRSHDGAQSWSPVGLIASAGSVWITRSAIFVSDLSDGSLHRSLDAGTTWHRTASVPPGGTIASLTGDPRSPRVVYAGTPGAGVFRSEDDGDTWEPFGHGLENLGVYALEFDASGRVLYAATSQGVFTRETRSPRVVAPR